MTDANPKRVLPRADTRHGTAADTRDLHLVTEYELLAENMPSVLRRLRPMDISSNGILGYLMTKRLQRAEARAAVPSPMSHRRNGEMEDL